MERLRTLGRFQVARMGATELEITAAGVTKATGALILMDHLGVERRDVVAFGDGGNDLPLAEVATFVAMGNADEEVRQAADEVCGTVAADGVATWIESRLGV
jgi:hydroxymethylpyrimidine pyrophosphatase-like HAD family hydrolase